MKLIYIFLFLSAFLIQLNKAKYIDPLSANHDVDKRFIGQLGNWLNQNVVQPVTGAATVAIDSLTSNVIVQDYFIKPITSATNSIASWLTSEQTTATVNEYLNWLNQNVVNPVTGAASWTVEQLTNGFYWTVNAITASSNPIAQEINPCEYTCFNRIIYNDTVFDYEFDKPNGCVSKGLFEEDLYQFDQCCDTHNKCLNSQCCTTNCEALKMKCDLEFSSCMNKQCSSLDNDLENLHCNSLASTLNNLNADKKCKKDLNKSRKICLC